MNDEAIKAFNEGFNQGVRTAENEFISAMRTATQRIEELEDKHYDECRQIALYDDELRKAKELLQECYDAIDPDGHEGLMVEIEGALK